MTDDGVRGYRPIDCSIHDRLESAATQRTPVRIVFRAEDGSMSTAEDRIVDVFARGGVEYLRLAGGAEIRLDDLDSVDGVSLRG